jgi:hypothetical protein
VGEGGGRHVEMKGVLYAGAQVCAGVCVRRAGQRAGRGACET